MLVDRVGSGNIEIAHPTASRIFQVETRLHSWETYLWKYILPILFLPWDRFQTLRRAFPETKPDSRTTIWLAVFIWCVIFAFVVWKAWRVKTVYLNETGLRVCGYTNEIEIPLADIAWVKYNLLFKAATLHLSTVSAFGAQIIFIPRGSVPVEQGRRATLQMLDELIKRK